jgi:hypothetical protein
MVGIHLPAVVTLPDVRVAAGALRACLIDGRESNLVDHFDDYLLTDMLPSTMVTRK